MANPVTFHSDHLKVLNETALPWNVEYLEVKNTQDAVSILKDMKTRAFGQVLLYYYYVLFEINKLSDGDILDKLREITEAFSQSRPTFAFWSFYGQIKSWWNEESHSPRRKEHLREKILSYLHEIKHLRLKRARFAARELPQGDILTHCNVSGEMVYIAEIARKELNKKLSFWITETRPYLQGARLTAWELDKSGVRVVVLPDALSAKIIREKRVKAAIVGSDRCTRKGDIVNKIGTYQIALACYYFKVPFYVLVQPPTADVIEQIQIEYRDPKQVLFFQGETISQPGVEALYPSFDITPADMVTKLIYFEGIYTPEEFRRAFSKSQIQKQ